MKNQTVQLFDFNGSHIRVVAEFNGQPYFVARDVAATLGFKNPSATVTNTCSNRVVVTAAQLKVHDTCTLKINNRGLSLIPESDLYRLVMRSKLPSAVAFQDWVCEVVLPAIRKDGAYIAGEEKVASGEMSVDEFSAKAVQVLEAKLERLATENARLATLCSELEAHNQELLLDVATVTLREWETRYYGGYLGLLLLH